MPSNDAYYGYNPATEKTEVHVGEQCNFECPGHRETSSPGWLNRFFGSSQPKVRNGFNTPPKLQLPSGFRVVRYGNKVPTLASDISWSPFGDKLATANAGPDGGVGIWDVVTGDCVAEYGGHETGTFNVDWARTTGQVACADHRAVRIWDSATGHLVDEHVPTNLSMIPHDVEWSPDATRIAVSSRYGSVYIWTPKSGEIKRLPPGDGTHFCVSWSPNGQLIASGEDAYVRIWDVTSGDLVKSLSHEAGVFRAQWSPDGRWLATANYDRKIRLWNVESGRCATILEESREHAYDIRWSADGSHLLASFETYSVLWRGASWPRGFEVGRFEGLTCAVPSPSSVGITFACYSNQRFLTWVTNT